MLLTKTDYIEGLTCKKQLWLKKFKRSVSESLTSSTLINIEEGNTIGSLAMSHPKFKDGTLIKTLNVRDALVETKLALKKSTPIFEAAFSFKVDNLTCFIRVDILSKNDDGTYTLTEVKSASNTTSRHYNDIAFQKWVLEQNGLKISICNVMKPNKQYKREKQLDIDLYFKIEECTLDVRSFYRKVPSNIRKFNQLLTNNKEYRSPTGSKCKNPFQCRYFKYCNKVINEDSIENLSRLREKKKKNLRKLKIKYIKDIPVNFPLSPKQSIQRQVAIQEKPHVSTEHVQQFLDKLRYPLYNLDFEAYSKSLPIFENSKPNQFIPFQASIHKVYRRKKMEHFEFLHTTKKDPRPFMIKFLLEFLGKTGSILVWHKSFEVTRIKELINDFPEFESELSKLIPRVVDLEEPFAKSHIYLHEFRGSSSIKKVLPALVDDVGYDRLDVQDGNDAQATYQQLMNGDFKGTARAKKIKELLEYCELDTFAMVKILNKVEELL